MIEIIKHGKEDTKFHLTCPFCACEFKYNNSDLEKEILHCNSFIKCPDCGAVIDHDFYQRKKISESLWRKWEKL